jgi:hypothetical protein
MSSQPRDIGDLETYWVADWPEGGYSLITTTLECRTERAQFWVERGLDIDTNALCESARRFEERVLPAVCNTLGQDWNDEGKIINVVNGRIPGVGGYFTSADKYPRSVSPYSNYGDILYINANAVPPGSSQYEGTLAHELQHLVHFDQDGNEDCWVNEGASELAMALAGYPDWRFAFAQSPDTQLNYWDDGGVEIAAHYEASYLFLEYFRQRAGGHLIQELIACPENGAKGFDRVLEDNEAGMTFEDLFVDWTVTNYLDDPSVGDGRFSYHDIDFQVASTHKHFLYPVYREASVSQYAADYICLEMGPGDVELTFYGLGKTKLVSEDPRRGEYLWWSNRGDLANSSLTREFDLREVEKATLQCWLWYDIEQDYDHAYVELSVDGGKSWLTLKGEHTTQDNPNGLNLGHALTGKSGGGDSPTWVKENFDLSQYTGKEISIRFEYVTDDAYNGEGLCIDDIVIPEIGYSDDFGGPGHEWKTEGFIRTNNQVPQSFAVRTITFGDHTHVGTLPISEDGLGKTVIHGLGGTATKAVIVVAAMAPKTTQPARYWYSVEPIQTRID